MDICIENLNSLTLLHIHINESRSFLSSLVTILEI